MYIILFRYKAKMSKCNKCFVRYCSKKCYLAQIEEHKPLCKMWGQYIARRNIPPGHESGKARKHSEKMRSHMRNSGRGFQFMDEDTYWKRLGELCSDKGLALKARVFRHWLTLV